MQFFESFYSLGYSGVVLLVTVFFVAGFVFSGLKMHKRHWALRAALLLAFIGIFVVSTNYLASERKVLMDAIEEDGGLKRTKER